MFSQYNSVHIFQQRVLSLTLLDHQETIEAALVHPFAIYGEASAIWLQVPDVLLKAYIAYMFASPRVEM